MSLLRAEARRLFKRRFTRWMLLIVLVIMGLTVAGIFASNTKPGPDAVAQARAEAERAHEEQQRWMERELADCQASEESGNPDWDWIEDCDEIREWYATDVEEMVEWYLPPTFDFRNSFPAMITIFAALLAMFGFIVGASFIGAEWRSGAMANLLVWRPRRLQVLGIKLATVLSAVLGLGVGVGAAWTGAFWWVALQRGITDNMTSGAWQSIALTGLRGVTLALVATALGFAVASLGRHTAMALGAAIGLIVVGYGTGIVLYLAGVSAVERWLFPTYLLAWMDKSVTIYDYSACDWSLGECTPPEIVITWQQSGAVMAVLVALLVGAAMWHMRRRDVT